MTDIDIEGDWVDHQSVLQQNINWEPGKPDGATGQNCAYQFFDNGDVFVDDAPCGHSADGWCSVCQNNPCDPGWTFYDNSCYKPICPDGGLTYVEAELLCQAEDAHLALPTSTASHNWVCAMHSST